MDEIFDMAVSLHGAVPEGREAALRTVCRAAEDELRLRLRDGISAEDIKESFVTAAGVLALSMYMLLSDSDEVSSFSAGNVSVVRRGSSGVRSSASALRKQAETMLSAYLKDSGFQFTGVRG